MQALANMVSPMSRSAENTRTQFLRDGGLEVLQERFQQFTAVPAVAEVACRCVANLAHCTAAARRMAELGTVKTLLEAISAHSDIGALQGDACRALVNLAQDEVAKKKVNELGGFQIMLQSQKRFEFNPVFWEMRWGMKQMKEGESVMVNYHGRGRWCSAKVLRVNQKNGAYDVSYAHGGMDWRVPTHLVRPKDKSDTIEEFVAVWQWKPDGKNTQDELTLKSDLNLTLKSQRMGPAGNWNVVEPKGGGRNIVKIGLAGEVNTIDMERISLTTLRSISSPHRAVLKDDYEDCLYVEYFSFQEGMLGQKPPPVLGRMPDYVRAEQQILWEKSLKPWTGLPQQFAGNFAARWKGLIEVTMMGTYEFFLEADTGATFWMNDKLMVSAPGKYQVQLRAGPQRICVMYFCSNSVSKSISLEYCGPDTGDERTVVPVAVMLHKKEECTMVPKPGLIAEYFPEEYEDGVIPEGIQADVVRVEKQLDFEKTCDPWQGLPQRYSRGFAARFTGYINVTCGEGQKANYYFFLESDKRGKLYVNDTLLVQGDNPGEIGLKKGQHFIKVEYFAAAKERHGLTLKYRGPETMPPTEET